MKKYLVVTAVMLLSIFQTVSAKDSLVVVRVGISDTNFRNYIFDNVEFNKADELHIIDAVTGYILPIQVNSKNVKIITENNLFKIYLDGELRARNLEGPILIYSKKDFVEIKNLKRRGKQAFYRGYIELIRSSKDNSKFSIVNVLSLRDYLKGVVPNEMPIRFGLEALKAQSVAARNYAIAPRIKAYEEFDLCDSVACQVYFGANTESEISNQAIEETDSIIAVDKEDKPILALYSSTAGGYTESYSLAFSDPKTRMFPSQEIDYLVSVPDDEKFKPLNDDKSAEEFYTTSPVSFDDMSPYYRWDKEWTKRELESVLNKTMSVQSQTGFITPAVEKGEDIGSLISIRALERGNSGKIVKLEIKTNKNTYIVEKELVIRRCFQKNGISLPSANFVISYIQAINPVYKFTGGGFGHGVGLSQWGAGKMGALGYTYDEILKHYYKGIELKEYIQNKGEENE